VIYDEQRLFSEAFAEALRQAGVEAVATFSWAEAAAVVQRDAPDLVVINVRPRPATAFNLVTWIRLCSPATRIVCLDADDRNVLRACMKAGTAVVMSKRQPLRELVESLLGQPSSEPTSPRKARTVATGRSQRQQIKAPLAAQFLTRREMDVLRLLVAAESTKNIARRLGVTVPTARGYIQSTFTKLGVHSRVEAVTYAVVHAVVDLEGTANFGAPG
jgi:two-component system nitrate/nitrite response regulator NarL